MKHFLVTPGPTPVPPNVMAVMAEPVLHHRSAEFEQILAEVREGLQHLYQTKNHVLIFCSSGTGAMEGAVANCLRRDDRALVVRGGKFGERWGEICSSYGIETTAIDVEWGKAVDPDDIERALVKDPSISALFVQATETSTGVRHPIGEIGERLRGRPEVLYVVDAITGIGVFDLPVDLWGIDVAVTGSQKALMLPPGLAFASVSPKAWNRIGKSDLPKYYFRWKKERDSLAKNQSAYTPAITLIVGLREVLRMMQEEGLPKVFARNARMAEATRAAMKALGLRLYAPDAPSECLTAVIAPDAIDSGKIVKTLRKKHGVWIAGGQAQAKGKIFRIAHVGHIDREHLFAALLALEDVLGELGYQVQSGAAVKAAADVLDR